MSEPKEPSRKRRIVIIVPDCGEGGLFQFYNQLVPALAQLADVHVVFASPTHSPLKPSIPGATCHALPPEQAAPVLAQLLQGPMAIAPGISRALAAAHQAWQFALTLAPDCVEVCDWPLNAVPAVIDGSIPVVVQCHGSMAQIAEIDRPPGGAVEAALLRLIEPLVLARAPAVQTYAAANARFWAAETGRTVAMVRPAFAVAGPPPSAASADGAILVFGRLQAWKGPQVLCAALGQMGTRAPVCDWYGSASPWPGSGIGADSHLAAAFPAVWGKALRYHGAIDRPAVAQLMRQARAVIVPSTWDVFNFTAIEAMAAGRPVLISSGAGASELIRDGVNGFVFERDDAAALTAAIDRLLALSPTSAQAMGDAARATIKLELDPARIAAERMAGYEAAMAAHALAPPQPASPWLRDLLTPGALQDFQMTDFLETLPARPMLRSIAGRARRKLALPGLRR